MILHGHQAVTALQKRIGRRLNPMEHRVVMLEGYATAPYRDIYGILTDGVGQTGRWIDEGFEAAFRDHLNRVKARLPEFDKYPEYLQCELMQAEYRGDLGHSPRTLKHIREHRFDQAAYEFLDNAEYRTGQAGICRRMDAVSAALKLYSLTTY